MHDWTFRKCGNSSHSQWGITLPLNLFLQNRTYTYLLNNAGFFPVNRKTVKQFAKLMIACMKECDSLASWRIEEVFILKYLKQAARISLGSLSPSNEAGDYAWYRVLKGKKS